MAELSRRDILLLITWYVVPGAEAPWLQPGGMPNYKAAVKCAARRAAMESMLLPGTPYPVCSKESSLRDSLIVFYLRHFFSNQKLEILIA